MHSDTKMLCLFYISLLCFSLVLCINIQTCKELNKSDNSSSCSYQLWSNETEDEDACRIRRLGLDSWECQSQLTETPANIPYRGFIKIEPFKDEIGSRTVFNITAYEITWNNLLIRFHQKNTTHCMKREFTIKKPVRKDKILFYDCAWALATFEDKLIDFEYAYGVNNIYDGKRTFVIHVPKSETIQYYHASHLQNVTLFIYLETTNFYQFICKIHTAPEHLNVTSYEIKVHFKKDNKVIRIDGPFVANAKDAVNGVIDFAYDTYGVPGEYVFYVQPWECSECRLSSSPVVIIPESSTIITIGIVGVSCIIPIVSLVLYMYLKVDSGSIPRVLLVTTPANHAHAKIGTSLANILKQKFNIPTMFDVIDIPIPNIMPENWFANSFESATHVVILISDDKPVTSIYRKIDKLLYTLVKGDPDKICCTIEFPFSKKVNLKFNVHRHFKLMEDYNAFINFIHKRGFVHRLIKKVMRNDLYHDLVKQIDDYNNDTTVYKCNNVSDETSSLSSHDEESSLQNEINSDDECSAQNEINHQEVDKRILEKVRIILNDVERIKMCDSDESEDDSYMESVNSDVQSCLEEISCKM